MGKEIGFLLVLLQIQPLGAAQQFPIHVPDIIAGDIFAVLGEFDGKAAQGGFMFAGHEAFDHVPRLQAEIFGLIDGCRVQQ